ncbi:hypothetical protein [Dactylosporangium sp. CA-139066]
MVDVAELRVVAEQIAAAPGLDVDITYGSSPTPQTVTNASGSCSDQ